VTIRRRERTRYVFTFGRARSGKSTLLASVTQHIASNRDVALIRNPLRPDGYTIVNRDWLGAIRAKEFPPESVSGELVEVDIGIKLLAAPKRRSRRLLQRSIDFFREPMNSYSSTTALTLFEMAGEDLQQVEVSGHRHAKDARFPEFVRDALMVSHVVLIVVERNRVGPKEDNLIMNFIDFMMPVLGEGGRVEPIPVALVVSKFDQEAGGKVGALEEFLFEHMPDTMSTLMDRDRFVNVAVLPFSVGDVNVDTSPHSIKRFDDRYAKSVVGWIYANCDV